MNSLQHISHYLICFDSFTAINLAMKKSKKHIGFFFASRVYVCYIVFVCVCSCCLYYHFILHNFHGSMKHLKSTPYRYCMHRIEHIFFFVGLKIGCVFYWQIPHTHAIDMLPKLYALFSAHLILRSLSTTRIPPKTTTLNPVLFSPTLDNSTTTIYYLTIYTGIKVVFILMEFSD